MWTLAGPKWQSAYARQMIARPAPTRPKDTSTPLVIAGLFNSANGIGEGARRTYSALQAAGLKPIAVDLSAPFAPVDLTTEIPCQPMPPDKEGTLILQLNGPETMSAMQHLGLDRARKWYTIGYWAWELPSFPNGWDLAFRYLSEIWTISDFSAGALRQAENAPPIHVFGHAVSAPDGLESDRLRFGWTKGCVTFLTMADSMSSLQRKNPFAAIRAFQLAFGRDPSRQLVVKVRNLDRKETAKSDLLSAIGDAPNIQLMDESLSDHDRWVLMASVDAVVSLHRAEGFGLVMAEAMALGKPVICTDWSGNMDFMTPESSALVSSTLVPCEDEYGVYASFESQWADADVADAADKMKTIANDRDYRRALGQRAKQQIERVASASQVGAEMAKRLSDIPRTPKPSDIS